MAGRWPSPLSPARAATGCPDARASHAPPLRSRSSHPAPPTDGRPPAEGADPRGIRRIAPPSAPSRPGHTGVATSEAPGSHPGTCAALVVSHHLGGLPSSNVVGMLQPTADPGVHRVSRLPVGGRSRPRAVAPRGAFHTPRRIPSPAAAPRHRGRCPPALPPDAGPMGSGPPIARRTSTHRCTTITLSPTSPPTSGWTGRSEALLHRRVRVRGAGMDTGCPNTVLPGLRSPSRSSSARSAVPTAPKRGESDGIPPWVRSARRSPGVQCAPEVCPELESTPTARRPRDRNRPSWGS